MTASGDICIGEVVHKRLYPVEHRLRYRVFSLLLDVDELEDTAADLRLFGLDRFNLFGLNQRQHGYRDGRSIAEFAWDQMRKLNLENEVSSIEMLFYPRILGFAFNQLTVYMCRAADKTLRAVIYEVRNTFGGNLTYVMPAGADRNGSFTHNTTKQFYVSPFNKVEGNYLFHVRIVPTELTVGVALIDGGKPVLRTHFRGQRKPLTDGVLLDAFLRHPMMTLKVVAGIHWEAIKLWRKGLNVQDGPVHPDQPIVYGS
ncbi:MAG: DUF1365 domain-containing protein [Rhizobiaceae bacterium]